MIVISVIGLFLGNDAAQGKIAGGLEEYMGTSASQTVQGAVAATAVSRSAGIWTALIGFAVMIFGASTVFTELKNALNSIWEVAPKPGRAIITLIRDRIMSLSLILSIGFLFLISLLVSAVIAGVSHYLAGYLPMPPWIWRGTDFALSLAVTFAIFATIFKILPDVQLRWRDVAGGALLTAGLFTAGKSLLAWYLGTSSVGSAFGAAGSVVVILLWVYYATSLLFFGAEFTRAQVELSGRCVQPEPHALPITEKQTRSESAC